MLAGIIQSPTAYDPAFHPLAALERRNVVLRQMLEQGYLTQPVYEESIKQALPTAREVQAPRQQTVEGVDAGYFTSWVQQQIIERYGAPRAFDGGLKIRTTLDLELQRSAEQAVNNYLAYSGGPTASLVAIENSTGEVRAMVGGRGYNESPFNLATEGERQPGSSFKAFDLAAALQDGISPDSVWTSKQKTFIVPHTGGTEKFVVHNDEGAYSGSNTLTGATAFSDNSIYAEVGLKVGTAKIAQIAHRMGITTPLSTNPAMTIGGLTVGVTPLDMAHSYETLAHGGERVTGSMAFAGQPVGIQEVSAGKHTLPDGSHRDVNRVKTKRVLPASVAQTETSMLETVVQYGTGRAAAIGQFAAGKTGTTSNYGDAWFVGWDDKYTVAVWVGYPDKLIPMTTDFNNGPVLGGTFPALIWHDFMTSALSIDKARAEHSARKRSGEGSTGTEGTSEGSESSTSAGESAGTSAGQERKSSSPSTRGGHGRRRTRRLALRPEPRSAQLTRPHAALGQLPRRPSEPSAPASPSPTGRRQPRRVAPPETFGSPAAQKRQGRSTALEMPILGPDRISGFSALRAPAPDGDRAAAQRAAVEIELDRQCLGQLARARAQLPLAKRARAGLGAARISSIPLERGQRPDQHGSPDPLVLTDGVQQGVDAVGAVDVCPPRGAEQGGRAGRQADEGVAGRLAVVVGLGLDDHSAGLAVARRCSRSAPGRPRRPGDRRTQPGGAASSTLRASSSCSRRRCEEVPPSETFDSSHDELSRT